MTHPKDIIPKHPQTKGDSCIAWGTEIVLLTFEKKIPNPSLQEAPSIGFNEARAILKAQGIISTDRAFGLDFKGFEQAVTKATSNGVYPAVILPQFYFYDEAKDGLGLANHTYLVCPNGGKLEFLTCESLNGPMVSYSIERFQKRYNCWANNVDPKDNLLHTLLPDPLSETDSLPDPTDRSNGESTNT